MLPLSMLVVYDSFIHSGSVPMFLRKRFIERPPANGGDEKKWIGSYVEVRHQMYNGVKGDTSGEVNQSENCWTVTKISTNPRMIMLHK
jgi:hypothetical protein